MERVVVIGSTGSGKTTVASRLASALNLPQLELDSVNHQPGWAQLPHDQFQDAVAAFVTKERWVVDGNYTSHGMKEVLWPLADTFVWLDMPRRVIMRRVVFRTIRRVATREELWNGNREPWTNFYHRDPERNIIVWAWTRYDHVRDKYEQCMYDGTWSHASVHHLRSPVGVGRFLSLVEEEATASRN
ncbi:MAG: adenylate kinase [Acidimicrobiia bacterium]